MSKGAYIALIILFSFALIGLVVYGVLSYINIQGLSSTTQGNQGNASNTTTTTQSEMDNFVKRFRDGFEAWHDLHHCGLISEANSFDPAQLKLFADTYLATYGITVVQQLDNAFVWCYHYPDKGQTLYNNLKAL